MGLVSSGGKALCVLNGFKMMHDAAFVLVSAGYDCCGIREWERAVAVRSLSNLSLSEIGSL